jgi:hypothetical protein
MKELTLLIPEENFKDVKDWILHISHVNNWDIKEI